MRVYSENVKAPTGQRWPSPNAYENYRAGSGYERHANHMSGSAFLSDYCPRLSPSYLREEDPRLQDYVIEHVKTFSRMRRTDPVTDVTVGMVSDPGILIP